MAKTDFKTVAKFSERMPAEILAGMLNDNGIPAAVFGADSTALTNVVGNIEVKVNAADYDAAMELINAPGEDVDEAEEETEGEDVD